MIPPPGRPSFLSGELCRFLFEGHASPMWVFDPTTLASLRVNAAAVRAYGYSREEFLSKTIQDIGTQEDAPRLTDVVRSLPSGLNIGILRHTGKDGSVMDVEITTKRIQRDGRPAHLAVVRDVTQSLKVERALRESEALMRQMTQAIQDVFYLSDAKTYRTIYINPAFERIWGRSREAVQDVPRVWLDWVHPDDRERVVRSLKEWKPQGEDAEWDEEFRVVRPDGAVRWIWIRSFPVRDPSGEIVRFTGVETDITERKRAEETVGSLLSITRQLSSTLEVDTLMEARVKETLRLLDAEGGFAGLRTP